MIKRTDKTGIVTLYEYDDKNQKIKNTSSDGTYNLFEYDSEGREIKRYFSSSDRTYEYEYDSFGNKIVEYKNSEVDTIREYDDHNNIIYYWSSYGTEEWTEYEYWSDGSIKKKTVYRGL